MQLWGRGKIIHEVEIISVMEMMVMMMMNSPMEQGRGRKMMHLFFLFNCFWIGFHSLIGLIIRREFFFLVSLIGIIVLQHLTINELVVRLGDRRIHALHMSDLVTTACDVQIDRDQILHQIIHP